MMNKLMALRKQFAKDSTITSMFPHNTDFNVNSTTEVISVDVAAQLISLYDYDNDGKLNFEEFAKLIMETE